MSEVRKGDEKDEEDRGFERLVYIYYSYEFRLKVVRKRKRTRYEICLRS